MNSYYNNLIKKVISLSNSEHWELAVQEWEIWDCEEDVLRQNSCVCGKEELRYLFTIRNRENNNFLYPIGSSCIKKFGRNDLYSQTIVHEDLFRLLHAIEDNEFITLMSAYFTRNLLKYLYEDGAFVPNRYNNFDEYNDYKFLLDMFNKRDKYSITTSQQRKIQGLIAYTIRPFLLQKLNDKIL